MVGPGKYDDLCTYVREQAKAEGAVVLVFNGKHGEGFSAQLSLVLRMTLPGILRRMADDIEKSDLF